MQNWTRNDQSTQDLLGLVDNLAMLSVIEEWTDQQCQEAESWASAQHFQASDNNVRPQSIPRHVRDLPNRARGAYDADISHL